MRTEEIIVGDEFDCMDDNQIWHVVHVTNGYAVMFLETEDVVSSEVVPLADLEAGVEWRRRELWPAVPRQQKNTTGFGTLGDLLKARQSKHK